MINTKHKPYLEVCDVPEEILNFLNDKLDVVNNISSMEILSKGYFQWNMQKEIGHGPYNRVSHKTDIWLDSEFKLIDDFFSKYITNIFKFRFSMLKSPYNVDWHECHIYPRIHIPLNDSDAIFQLKESVDSEVIEIPVVYGKAYLINVTMFHRVLSKNSPMRKNAFFCFEKFTSKDLYKEYTGDLSDNGEGPYTYGI